MLTKIERREKRQKLRGESVCRIIKMNVKVAGDDKFMGCGCCGGQKRTKIIEENREWFRMTGRRWRAISGGHTGGASGAVHQGPRPLGAHQRGPDIYFF